MEQSTRFVSSRDGTRIAYSVRGSGPALLYLMVPSLSHVELYPRLPGAERYLDRIGRGRTLIWIDLRGCGMSDRDFDDHSPEAMADDIEAVVDALGVHELDLHVGGARVSPALCFALRRPEAVRRIVLGYPYTARPGGVGPPNRTLRRGYLNLMQADWDAYVEMTTQRNTGRPMGELEELLAVVKRCMDQRNYVAESKAHDPSADWQRARKVTCPVLVLEYTNNTSVVPGRMEAFARQFPNARFMALPEGSIPPPYGDPELVHQAIEEFLGPAPKNEPSKSPTLSARESEVLKLLAEGRTQPEIAAALFVSPSTVSGHVVNLYAKLGVHRRAEAVSWAIRHGLA